MHFKGLHYHITNFTSSNTVILLLGFDVYYYEQAILSPDGGFVVVYMPQLRVIEKL